MDLEGFKNIISNGSLRSFIIWPYIKELLS